MKEKKKEEFRITDRQMDELRKMDMERKIKESESEEDLKKSNFWMWVIIILTLLIWNVFYTFFDVFNLQ